jgi:hypothetical protein
MFTTLTRVCHTLMYTKCEHVSPVHASILLVQREIVKREKRKTTTHFAIFGIIVDLTNVKQWNNENVANGINETITRTPSQAINQLSKTYKQLTNEAGMDSL